MDQLNNQQKARVQATVVKDHGMLRCSFAVPTIEVDEMTLQRLIKANNGDKNAAVALILYRTGVKIARDLLTYVDGIDGKVQIPITEPITM